MGSFGLLIAVLVAPVATEPRQGGQAPTEAAALKKTCDKGALADCLRLGSMHLKG